MISYFKHFGGILLPLLLIASCNIVDVSPEVDTPSDGKHHSKMVFKCNVSGYEGTTIRNIDTKSTSSWEDGDVVYIAFYNKSTVVPGTAVYSATEGWSVSYDGDLSEGSSQKCEARFFVNTTFANENLVTLNPHTEIYEDLAGTYSYSNGTLTVTASLSPKVGRIRFTGTSNDKIHVTGITTHTTYSPAGNLFSTTQAPVSLTVDKSGSTPYVYGSFAFDDCKIGIVGSDFAFTRTCSSSIFQKGDSGYMKIPSTAAHNNWKAGLIITINGVDFKMIPVAGYTGGFYMAGETEVTTALYNAVNGTASSDQTPIDNISYTTIQTWIEKLNNDTKLTFALPSSEQWLYAAKGGSLSQNYTYAGSNTPGDVAWYSANTSAKQNVKTKAPNELGIYDMSGNVAEFTTTMYSDSYPYIYGGSYKSKVDNITKTSCFNTCTDEWYNNYHSGSVTYNSSNCKSSGIGFRLILTFSE